MKQNRRHFLGQAGAGAAAVGLASIGFPALAQSRTKIRVGYLHTLAVDGQLWLAQHLGAWQKNGLDPEFKQFTTTPSSSSSPRDSSSSRRWSAAASTCSPRAP
jgi:NitT/TauT family transport system substrate-binding protein